MFEKRWNILYDKENQNALTLTASAFTYRHLFRLSLVGVRWCCNLPRAERRKVLNDSETEKHKRCS